MEKIRPPPRSTYEPSKEQIELENIRDENHRRGLHKLNQTRSLCYHFMNTEKSTKTLNKQAKPMEENIQFRANPPPSKPQVYFSYLIIIIKKRFVVFFHFRQIKFQLN